MKRFPALFAASLLLLCCPAPAAAQIPQLIAYQGLLTDSTGSPKPDGTYLFIFRLYDSATGETREIWREIKELSVSTGHFSTLLGDQEPFAGSVDFSKPYWLGIQVGDAAELVPRFPLSAAAYSLRSVSSDSSAKARFADSSAYALAAGLADGVVVRSVNGLHDNIVVSGSGGATVTSNGDSIIISASGSGSGSGIQGIQNTNNTLDITNPNGPTATVNVKLPFSASTSTGATTFEVANLSVGVGLSASSAGGDGLFGSSAGEAKSGIWGDNTGGGYGVAGSTGGAATAGVWGSNSGSGFGVKGTSATGTGVYGQTSAGGGGYGVAGEHTALAGGGIGVYGRSAGPTGTGVYGWANSGVGINYGVYGQSGSAAGYAGYFVGRGYFSSDVGVGTATPEARLHVANTIRVGKDLTYPSVYGEIKHDGGSTGFIIGARAGGGWADLHLQTDGTTKLFVESQGNVGIGTVTPAARLDVNGTAAVTILQINGGSDLAEPFVADDPASAEPGMLVVLDADAAGRVAVSSRPYDRKVAGVVSGAGGVNAGLTLRQNERLDGDVLVAIAGRVYCRAVGPVEPGDLLTTSSVTGHAMRAADRDRSHGAIVGKALSRLAAGRGLVLMLVNLQ